MKTIGTLIVVLSPSVSAFVANCPTAFSLQKSACTGKWSAPSSLSPLYATEDATTSDTGAGEKKADVSLETVEMLGKGSAKSKRGKRKGGIDITAAAPAKAAAALAPEEIYYEGPPAISETIAPTISILTVVGIIPAAAAWARQAWVRYKITTRRIRVTSGIQGKDMAEIVYPDIVEIRTAKRLFGDGDLVAFLRDGAKFEMRNIPEFDVAMEFILKQCDPDVVEQYRSRGDVSTPPEE